MATQTPNLGLTLPVGTENVSRQVINGNNTLIDTFAGGVNTAMDQMGSNLGILETGDTATHAIAKGEYVTWKGASYTADAAISIGETLAATGGSKNLTACDKGIANALNSNMTSNNFGQKVLLNSYNSASNKYTFPSDGYIHMNSGGSYAICYLYGANESDYVYIEAPYVSTVPAVTQLCTFVKKGMKVYFASAPDNQYFVPLV